MNRKPKAQADADAKRTQAWNILLRTKLNVYYWQEMWTRRDRLSRSVAGIVLAAGIGASLCAKTIGASWAMSAISAGFSLLASLTSHLMTARSAQRLESFYERWSGLYYEIDSLWLRGEEHSWRGSDVSIMLVRLEEREKHYQSTEYASPNAKVLVQCERRLWSELGLEYNRPQA